MDIMERMVTYEMYQQSEYGDYQTGEESLTAQSVPESDEVPMTLDMM